VETKAEKIRIAETKRRRKRRRRKKMRREEAEERREGKKKKKKPKRERTIEVKRVVEEWEIWDEGEKAVKLEKKSKEVGTRMFSLVNSCVWKETE